MFSDRRAAGEQLAAALAEVAKPNPLILAIPRGGVPVAFPVWRRLGGDLDIIQPRKMGSPFNPELAIGAVAPDGTELRDAALIARLGVGEDYLRREAARQAAEAARRLRFYRGDRPPPRVGGRHVILVDDGVATGITDLLALRLLRRDEPARLTLAVPVGPAESIARLRAVADEVLCLEEPLAFQAVGEYYAAFPPVSDDEVIRLLKAAWEGTRLAPRESPLTPPDNER